MSDSSYSTQLPQRLLQLCACAALEARGDLRRLDEAIRTALDDGVTINELKEAFSHLYAYTGFPRALNALSTLQHVLDDRKQQGISDVVGIPFERPAMWDNAQQALEQGTAVQTLLEGGIPWDYDFCPQADYYMKSHLFGDVFASRQLSPADRELVTVSALSAMDGVEPQFEGHKECAVFIGNSKDRVAALCQWLDENGYSNNGR